MFRHRKDAGEKLAQALERYRNENTIVLGIPRGGVEIAYYVANHLHAEMSIIVARKLGNPRNPEFAFGATAEDGSMYIDAFGRQTVTDDEIKEIAAMEKKEIRHRIEKFRHNKPLPEIKNRTVILVDDGIATGATLFAAIELCKKKGATKIVVGAPISGREMKSTLNHLVDDVVILEHPNTYYAVSQGYEEFSNLSDAEALAIVDKWEHEQRLME